MSEIIYGIHAIKALLDREPQRFLEIFIVKEKNNRRLQPLMAELKANGLALQSVSAQFMDKQVQGSVHQGIVAKIKAGRQYQESDLPPLLEQLDIPFLLILDGVTDPHNLGACLRSADAAGVHAVIVPHDRSAQLNAAAKKVASGAAENVPLIRVTNLARTLRLLQQHHVWLVGAQADGETSRSLYHTEMTGAMALIMGAEGEGMRRLTRDHCDELITIPMAGTVSCLNISVATGVCLFEVVRQRSKVKTDEKPHLNKIK